MQLVRQKQYNHCAIASLAMVTELTYETILKQLGNTLREGGVNDMYVRQFLWDHGYKLRQLYQTELPQSFHRRKEWPVTFADKHMVMVTPHHWVAMNATGIVFDPNRDGEHSIKEYKVYSIIGVYT